MIPSNKIHEVKMYNLCKDMDFYILSSQWLIECISYIRNNISIVILQRCKKWCDHYLIQFLNSAGGRNMLYTCFLKPDVEYISLNTSKA